MNTFKSVTVIIMTYGHDYLRVVIRSRTIPLTGDPPPWAATLCIHKTSTSPIISYLPSLTTLVNVVLKHYVFPSYSLLIIQYDY